MLVKDIVQKYVGMPYAHQGRGPYEYDCWGVILAVYRDIGITINDVNEYPDPRSWRTSVFAQNKVASWKTTTRPFFPDVVLFSNKEGMVIHAGVVVSDTRFLHCSRKTGVAIGKLHDARWKQSIEGYYRWSV